MVGYRCWYITFINAICFTNGVYIFNEFLLIFIKSTYYKHIYYVINVKKLKFINSIDMYLYKN